MLFPLTKWKWSNEDECNYLYKITFFAPIDTKQLYSHLKALRFHPKESGLELHLDGTTFRIEPFKNQSSNSEKGYRIYFDCDIQVGLYLLDMALSSINGYVTGIECVLSYSKYQTSDWLYELRNKRRFYKVTDSRGLFEKDGIGIIVVNNTVTIQVRARKKSKLKIAECINKIDSIREELTPTIEFDLFSLPDENEITA